MPHLPLIFGATLVLAYLLPIAAVADEVLNLIHRGKRADGKGAVTFVDLDPRGRSPGDMFVFYAEIYDKDNVKLLGYESGWCVRTAPIESDCIATITLAEGQIMQQGRDNDDKPDAIFAVTGGTGRYANARGVLSQRLRGARPDYEYEYVITLNY